mmetsp:Transcript_9179/g.18986  ORF Transcript_9179/g.18986 Transcript_9179/m.18986 type:complete len:81 (+) Transcript_9179:389-631(+)
MELLDWAVSIQDGLYSVSLGLLFPVLCATRILKGLLVKFLPAPCFLAVCIAASISSRFRTTGNVEVHPANRKCTAILYDR